MRGVSCVYAALAPAMYNAMTRRRALGLFALTAITAAADGQPPGVPARPSDTIRPGSTQNLNWVDTITVGRLPTGSCEWSNVQARMRPGKRGTTTMPGLANETTCTVLAYNYTTGSERDFPSVYSFAYVQDRQPVPPKNAVLNFADTFTVARKPDGSCDWSKMPLRTGKPGSGSYLAGVLVKNCWGVVYNVTHPPQDTTGMKADTTTVVFFADGPAPSPTALADVALAILTSITGRGRTRSRRSTRSPCAFAGAGSGDHCHETVHTHDPGLGAPKNPAVPCRSRLVVDCVAANGERLGVRRMPNAIL